MHLLTTDDGIIILDQNIYTTPKNPERDRQVDISNDKQIQLGEPMNRLSLRVLLSISAISAISAMHKAESMSHTALDRNIMPYLNNRERNRNPKRNPPKKLANKGLGKGRRRWRLPCYQKEKPPNLRFLIWENIDKHFIKIKI